MRPVRKATGLDETAGSPKDAIGNRGSHTLPETPVMRQYVSVALAAVLAVACSSSDLTGPNDRDTLMRDRVVLAVGVDSTTGASIETNLDDYMPGEVVHLVGRGWAPNETVNLHMTEQPDTHADVDTNVVADATGGFSIHFYDVQTHDLGVTFTLTATGGISGSQAVATFTDGDLVTLAVFASGCSTAQTSFALGATVCAKGTTAGAATETVRFTWTRPDASTIVTLGINTAPVSGVQTVSNSQTANQSGNWTVHACRLNPGGSCVGTQITRTFTVGNNAPNVNAGGAYTVAEGTELTLSPTVTDDENDPLTYKWTVNTANIDAGGICTFDDDTAKNAKVTCTDDSDDAAGDKFILTLEVKDPTHTVTHNADLTVNNVKPTADANGDYNGTTNTDIQLDGEGDDAGNNDDTGLTYKWTVLNSGIGTCTFTPSDAVADPTVECTQVSSGAPGGVFKLELVVSDDDSGVSDKSTANLTITNDAPVVSAGGPYSVAEGSSITLSTASATDPNNDPLTYTWTLNSTGIDGGGTCTIVTNNLLKPSVSCTDDSQNAAGGKFVLTLSVDDGHGHVVTDNADFTVTNANPVAGAGLDQSGNEGASFTVTGTKSDAGSNDTHTYKWTWSPVSGVDAGASCSFVDDSALSTSVSCNDDGVFKLTFTVKDDDTGEHSDYATLTLANVAPTAGAGNDQSGNEGSGFSLNGTKSDPGSNDTHTYKWTFTPMSGVDAGASCGFVNDAALSTTVSCTDDGVYKLTLTVKDDDTGEHSDDLTLTLGNVAPTAGAGGSYNDNEGANVSLNGSKSDPGANDTHTYKWTWAPVSGVDAGATCSFSDDLALTPTVSCTDDGVYKLTLTVKDDDTGEDADDATLTLGNVNPTAGAGNDQNGNEGATISLTGTKSDPGSNDTHTYKWTWTPFSGVDGGASCTFSNDAILTPTVSCTDDGVFTLTLTVKDDDLGEHSDDMSLTLANKNPTIAITSHLDGALFSLLNGPVSVTGAITEAGTNDTHTCRLELTGVMSETGAYKAATGLTCNPSVVPDEAGVYTLTIRVTDDDGGEGTASIMIVVFDPSAGFVTGGGWINSAPGAYKLGPSLGGKANFGFVSKYKKGATIPEGNTEFQFHAGGMNFHSTDYEWLVVNQAGTNAQFKGTGTINGQGSYTFMLWATDNGNAGDTFRIKITDNNNGNSAVYDNGIEQVIANGSIVIHTGGKK